MSNRSSWESRKLRYWAQCTGQSRRAALRTSHPALTASPAQTRLESYVLEQLGTPPDLCAHPFGICFRPPPCREAGTMCLESPACG
ncbi:hypothetical protein [Streptomyces sp. NPDC003032]